MVKVGVVSRLDLGRDVESEGVFGPAEEEPGVDEREAELEGAG